MPEEKSIVLTAPPVFPDGVMFSGKTEQKSVKHTFTRDERDALQGDLLNGMTNKGQLEAEFDSVKSSYKAKISEADSKIATAAASLMTGFEFRKKACRVAYRAAVKKKDYYLEDTGELVITEDMTGDDFQQELIAAESGFECREEIKLWKPAGQDSAVLVVGRLRGKWYSALRLRVGAFELAERLDSEQKAFKQRVDAVSSAGKRSMEWLKANVRELADGFRDSIYDAVAAQKDREE